MAGYPSYCDSCVKLFFHYFEEKLFMLVCHSTSFTDEYCESEKISEYEIYFQAFHFP